MTPEEVVKELEDAAKQQECFAGPQYVQCDAADRRMFLHAARVLRMAAERFRLKYGVKREAKP
jgi:hypothetical protein